jgi:hypothetical protein
MEMADEQVGSTSTEGEEGAISPSGAATGILAALLGSESEAKRAFAVLAAAGYVCVPREPTSQMLEAGWAPAHNEDAGETWREMVNAACG